MGFDHVKLEKGMYRESGKTFTQVLESLDPSENYKGTALEGTDAFQRQLKRFDIHAKGAYSDPVEKFFRTMDSSVLFPEYIERAVKQGMEENNVLPKITASTTTIDAMDYRSVYSVPSEQDKMLMQVSEGASIPATQVKTKANLVKLNKRGRMLVASYEAIRFQKLDLFSVTLRQIGAYIQTMHLKDAVEVLVKGDGNNNAAASFTIGDSPLSGTAGTLTYQQLVEFWAHNGQDAGAERVPESADGSELPGHGRTVDAAGRGASEGKLRGRRQDYRSGQTIRSGNGAGGRCVGRVRQAH